MGKISTGGLPEFFYIRITKNFSYGKTSSASKQRHCHGK